VETIVWQVDKGYPLNMQRGNSTEELNFRRINLRLRVKECRSGWIEFNLSCRITRKLVIRAYHSKRLFNGSKRFRIIPKMPVKTIHNIFLAPAVVMLSVSMFAEMRVLNDAKKFTVIDNDSRSAGESLSSQDWYYSIAGVVKTSTGRATCCRRSENF